MAPSCSLRSVLEYPKKSVDVSARVHEDTGEDKLVVWSCASIRSPERFLVGLFKLEIGRSSDAIRNRPVQCPQAVARGEGAGISLF